MRLVAHSSGVSSAGFRVVEKRVFYSNQVGDRETTACGSLRRVAPAVITPREVNLMSGLQRIIIAVIALEQAKS